MRVIVTRPEREAQDWVQALQQAGYAAQALPLIGIGPAPDLDAVHRAWRQLHQYLGVMFVSANAVAGFFAARPADAVALSADAGSATRAWATGPGTTQALLRAGVPAERIHYEFFGPADELMAA